MSSANVDQITAVARQLKHLREDVVFVGGSTTALLVDPAGQNYARRTKDVDFIIDISLRIEFVQFERAMRAFKFAFLDLRHTALKKPSLA